MKKAAKTKTKGLHAGRVSQSARTTKRPSPEDELYARQPELHLSYDTAPVGLAFLTPDCRYVQVNQRLTEICGMSVADHIGRSVRETVPQLADQVEATVQAVLRTGEPVMGIEVNGQRSDKLNAQRSWL